MSAIVERNDAAAGALGGAIAAGVAVVSVFIARSLGPTAPVQAPEVARAQPAATTRPASLVAQARPASAKVADVAEDSLPPSYTTPVDNSPASLGPGLANYVSMHSEVAASAVRFSQMSSMMNGGYDPTPVCRFGNSRIKACLRLPETYRSLPRPSSPLSAKAFPVRP